MAVDELMVAGAMEDVAAAELAAGVADLTRAADAATVAARMGQLSEVVAAAGDVDIAQAIHLLSASEDVEVMSAVVGVMSEADLEHGLQLARLSGELRVAGDIVDLLELPTLSGFLWSRGDRVNGMAVNAVLRSTSTRALAAAMAATGTDLASLSVENVADGIVRMAAADAMATRSDELAVASMRASRAWDRGVDRRRGPWRGGAGTDCRRGHRRRRRRGEVRRHPDGACARERAIRRQANRSREQQRDQIRLSSDAATTGRSIRSPRIANVRIAVLFRCAKADRRGPRRRLADAVIHGMPAAHRSCRR